MQLKVKVAITTTKKDHNAKVAFSKDIDKVYQYFRYTTGTTLDAMIATGVLRNSITWYVDELMKMGVLKVVAERPDSHTGRIAQYYSADPNKWGVVKTRYIQLTLFDEEDFS